MRKLQVMVCLCVLFGGVIEGAAQETETKAPQKKESQTTSKTAANPPADEDKKDEDKNTSSSTEVPAKPETPAADKPTEPTKPIETTPTEKPPVKKITRSPVVVAPKTKPTQQAKDSNKMVAQSSFGDVRSFFTFGSYARVRTASDLNGSTARPVNVVTHGSRVDEYSYAELEFAQRFEVPHEASTFFVRAVATLALDRDFFHFTGEFDQSIATRNLFGEAGWKLLNDDLFVSFWAGSRMYRGDDIYLLDFWPLDNLNTVGGGGGVAYNFRGVGRSEFKVHVGANRLLKDYQFQVVEVPGLKVGSEEIVFLDRQRFISSYRLQQDIWLDTNAQDNPTMGMKLVLYGENHSIDEGERRTSDGLGTETLPAEDGYKLGAQLGFWVGDGFFKGSFANLFYTYGSDLAAYGEFGIPTGVNNNKTSEGASIQQVALSSNLETPYAGLLLGAYYKYFQDADRESVDYDDYWEAIFAARLHGYVTDHIHPGIEISYQVRQPEGPFQGTGRFEAPAITKLTLMQAISLDKGMYSRPQLRLLYTRSWLNSSAQALYRPEDARSQMATQQYFGVMVEWWFNNASLFRP